MERLQAQIPSDFVCILDHGQDRIHPHLTAKAYVILLNLIQHIP